MPREWILAPKIFRSVLLAGLLVITSSAHAAGVERGDELCAGATPVSLNSSLRGYGDKQGEPFLVRLEVPSAGILSLDVTVPGTSPAEPKLGFAPGCGTSKAGPGPAVLERSATHLLLAAPAPGAYLFRVGSQDALLPLREFKLKNGFVPEVGDRNFTKEGEDEEEIEVEPNPLVSGGAGESRSFASQLHGLCRSGEVDDHGDSFSCATLVSPGREAAGEIRNGWGDDADVFLFVLGGSRGTELWTVELQTAGDLDTFGGLYDRSGQRLAASGGGGGNLRIVRTLAPGTYFVRVEGRDGAEGFYSLRIEASPW